MYSHQEQTIWFRLRLVNRTDDRYDRLNRLVDEYRHIRWDSPGLGFEIYLIDILFDEVFDQIYYRKEDE